MVRVSGTRPTKIPHTYRHHTRITSAVMERGGRHGGGLMHRQESGLEEFVFGYKPPYLALLCFSLRGEQGLALDTSGDWHDKILIGRQAQGE